MVKEKKQAFTRRITQANKTQLVVVVYEIFLVYLEDALEAYKTQNMNEFRQNIAMARECIAHMRTSLDLEYQLARNLFSIYCFADRELANDYYGNKTDNLDAIRDIFTKLHDAYDTISKNDDSKPLMDNIQDVYAGLTYGKNDLNESLVNYDNKRGYLV